MNAGAQTQLSRRTLLGGAMASAGLLLTGCSDTAPKEGTKALLRVAVAVDPKLGKLLSLTPGNGHLARTVFDYLIDKQPDGSYRPMLAESWEWNSAKDRLVVKLRSGVTYHSGRDFGPDDVIATLQQAMKPASGSQLAQILKFGEDVKKTGPAELTFILAKPFAGYLDALAGLPILDKTTLADLPTGKKVVGTGPYVWEKWTPGSSIKLKRNKSYWREGRPHLDGVEFSIISSPQATLTGMQADNHDLALEMLPRDAASLVDDDRFRVLDAPAQDTYLGVNTKVEPFDDVRVRQAVAYALDRDRIAKQVYGQFATASCVPWAKSTPGIEDAHVDHYSYDPGKAKALLEEAGKVGAEVAVAARSNKPSFVAAADIVHFGLEEAGFKPKVTKFDAPKYAEMMQGGDFPGLWIGQVGLTVLGQVTSLVTANPFVVGGNTSNVTDKKYGALVGAVVGAASDDERAPASTELTDYLLDQAFHNTVVQEKTPVVQVKGLQGVKQDLYYALDLTEAKLEA